MFDLTSRLFDVVRGDTLLVELEKIIAKLADATKSAFTKHVELHGVERVMQVLDQAKRLRYYFSEGWKSESFMSYLMFLDYNQPIGWRLYPHKHT